MFRFPPIPRERLHVQWRSIYLRKRLKMAGGIAYLNFQSVPFCMVKNVKTEHAVFMFRFPRFFTMENGTDWKLNQSMSLSISIHFQGYVDLRCTWKRFQDISGKPKRSIFLMVRFPLISRKLFHVQQRLIYPWQDIETGSVIDWFNLYSVPLSMVKNETCSVFYVPFTTFL